MNGTYSLDAFVQRATKKSLPAGSLFSITCFVERAHNQIYHVTASHVAAPGAIAATTPIGLTRKSSVQTQTDSNARTLELYHQGSAEPTFEFPARRHATQGVLYGLNTRWELSSLQ